MALSKSEAETAAKLMGHVFDSTGYIALTPISALIQAHETKRLLKQNYKAE